MYEAKKKKEKLYRRDSFFHRKNSVHCVHVLQCICCNTANLQKYHPFFSLFSESRFFHSFVHHRMRMEILWGQR